MTRHLCMSPFLLYLCRRIVEDHNNMVATQPTFNQVYDLAAMLTWQDQRRLIQRMQYNILHNEEIAPIEREELLARVERADATIDEGHYMEHKEAKQHFQTRKAQKTKWL